MSETVPMTPPDSVARLVGQIAVPERVEPTCSKCGGDLALATGVCLAPDCGHDEMGYWDDWDFAPTTEATR